MCAACVCVYAFCVLLVDITAIPTIQYPYIHTLTHTSHPHTQAGAGVGLVARLPIGRIEFNYTTPLRAKPYDATVTFQPAVIIQLL